MSKKGYRIGDQIDWALRVRKTANDKAKERAEPVVLAHLSALDEVIAEQKKAAERAASSIQLAEQIARMTTSSEFDHETPDCEDYISTLNALIEKARDITGIEPEPRESED